MNVSSHVRKPQRRSILLTSCLPLATGFGIYEHVFLFLPCHAHFVRVVVDTLFILSYYSLVVSNLVLNRNFFYLKSMETFEEIGNFFCENVKCFFF